MDWIKNHIYGICIFLACVSSISALILGLSLDYYMAKNHIEVSK